MAHSSTEEILKSLFCTQTDDSIELNVITAGVVDHYVAALPESEQQWLSAINFQAKVGQATLVPHDDSHYALAVVSDSELESLGSIVSALPVATYHLNEFPEFFDLIPAAIGWGLDQYRFEHYLSEPKQEYHQLILDDETLDVATKYLSAHFLVRDLINTPTENMGPSELSFKMQELASEFSAEMEEIKGAELEKDYPAIWTVGRASDDDPRLLRFTWGDDSNPRIALVGKGVCFDSGGLDIKPASGMRLMKKDMGGAAHVLGLARLIMSFNLPIHLDVYVSAVENSISGNAFRPGDVIKTRQGITVEVGNTDAEGRLVLSDALTRASEFKPEIIFDFATLTGAARVALGSDLPALFCNNEELANKVLANGERYEDPIWRLPLHQPYKRFLNSKVADIENMSSSPLGGAITAALFLENFIGPEIQWCHFDVMGYSPSYRSLHPEGGEAFALMAVFHTLEDRYCA